MALAKNRKTKQKNLRVLFRAEGPLVMRGPEVHAFPPAPLHANHSADAVMHWKVGKFVLWCSFSSQVKMPLIRVGLDLDRDIALDWFVLQTQLQAQTFWSVHAEDCADISRGENRQFQKKVLMSNSQFTSLSLARAWRYAYGSKSLKASECCEEFRRFVWTRVETSRPQDGVAARPNAFSALMAGQAAHSRALRKAQLPKRKDVERLPRSGWRLFNCVIDLLEEKKLGFIRGTAQSKGVHWKFKPVSDPLPCFVPAWIERMAMRNVHKPQLFLNLLTAHPDGLNRPELHGHAKLPPLNQNWSISSRRVERQASYSPSSPMASSEQMEGGLRGSMRKKEILLWAECWSLCTYASRYRDCLYDKTMTEVACLFWCSIYVLPLFKWLVRPLHIFLTYIVISINSFFCFLSAFLFVFARSHGIGEKIGRETKN